MSPAISFESLSHNLIVNDVNKSVDYYANILGFTLIASVPETGIFNWAMVIPDSITVMLQTLPSLKEDLPELKITTKENSGTFYINPDYAIAPTFRSGKINEKIFGFSQNFSGLKPIGFVLICSPT